MLWMIIVVPSPLQEVDLDSAGALLTSSMISQQWFAPGGHPAPLAG